jgi:hypothetical protein
MLHTGREKPLPKLVWIGGLSFGGWGCSQCDWVFDPAGQPIGASFEETKQNFQTQLIGEFASHECAITSIKCAE